MRVFIKVDETSADHGVGLPTTPAIVPMRLGRHSGKQQRHTGAPAHTWRSTSTRLLPAAISFSSFSISCFGSLRCSNANWLLILDACRE
jgi:hypothetical protein